MPKRQNCAKSSENEPKRVRLPIDHRNRADQARQRLGVKQEDVDAALKIGHRLREVGLTTERVVEILDADDSEESRLFLAKYRTISRSDLAYLSIEELCLAAGLTPRKLWEAVSGARLVQSQDAVKLIIADSMPKVVSNAIKAATEAVPILDGQGEVQGWTYGDTKAAESLFKISGLMPMPKGSTTVFNVGNQLPIPESEPDAVPLEAMDTFLNGLQGNTKQLEAPKVEFIQNAEYQDVPLER